MAKNGFKVMDSDMHIMEPRDLWQKRIDSKYKSQAPEGIVSKNVRSLTMVHPDGQQWGVMAGRAPHRGHNFERNQKLYESHAERGWTADVQLEAMDVEGIDTAVLFPTRGLNVLSEPGMDPGLAAALARAYNDWLAEFCSTNPDRLVGAGMISPFNVEDAVSEVHRCAEELHFRGIFVRSNIMNGHNWHDDYYEPLWNALEKLDIPLGFHESSSSLARQVGDNFEPNFMLRRSYAQPMEQMLALGSFCAGGVLARHPKLRVAFLEANCSWLPWLLWRLDESYEREGDVWAPDIEMTPSEYFKKQCFVSVEPDEAPVKYVLDYLGNDHIVFSTDYPHGDSKYPKAVESFLEVPISDEAKRKILWDNCAAYYQLS